MKLTPVLLLALVPLISFSLIEAAKNKEKNQQKSAAENSGKAKQSAKSGNSAAKSASAKASDAKAVKNLYHFGVEGKSGGSKKNAHQMKSAAEAAKAKHNSAKSSDSQKSAINKEKHHPHLTAPLLSQEAAAKKAENHQHEHSKAAAAKAAEKAGKAAAESKAFFHHETLISSAKKNHHDSAKSSASEKTAAAAAAAAAHKTPETAPCPFCKAGAEPSLEAKKPHPHQKQSPSASVSAKESSKEASVNKRNFYLHHQSSLYNQQQPAYLTNHYTKPAVSYNHQHHHSKPVYGHENSYHQNHHQYGHNDYQQQQQDTLIQANVISRLGDRTPFWLPRNDYYKEKDFPEGLSQLINVGKERLVNYGRVLRQRYQNLINNLRRKDIITQSAPDRVNVESALALLAGLLPPTGDQVWSPGYNSGDNGELARLWQPNAVWTVEAQRSWKLSTDTPCRTAELVENVTIIEEAPELKHFLAVNREVIKRLEVLTGESLTRDLSWIWIANLYDTYLTEAEYFGPAFYPPRWGDEQTLAVLREAFQLRFSVWRHDQGYLRLRGGPLVHEITENLIKAAKDEEGGKSLHIYSTYDDNIAITEHLLGIFRGGQAGYGSGLLIELHKNAYHKGGEPVVSVFVVDVPGGVKISQVDLSRSERFGKHCGGYNGGPNCPLSSFVVALQNHLLTREEAEVKCNNV